VTRLARAVQPRSGMSTRFALALISLAGSGCLYLLEPGDDDLDDPSPSGPPPVLSTCGNGVREAREACDDGNLADADGCSSCRVDLQVRVHWQLTTLAGAVQACPDGFDTAEVVARQSTWTLPISRPFSCEAGTGEVMLPQPGFPADYDLQVRIKSSATGELYGLSAVDRLIASEPRRDSRHTVITDAGMIDVFAYPYLGAHPRFCPGIPLTSFDVVVRDAAGEIAASHTFPCERGGVTQMLPIGTYRVEVSAVSGTGAPASAVIEAVTVPGGGQTVMAPAVKLVF
jgi:cysteine-rich repeat protein